METTSLVTKRRNIIVITIVLLILSQCISVSGWLHMLSRGRVVIATVGETIRLDCDFRTNQFDLFENPLVWEKTQFSSDSIQLNMMGNVLEPFASTKRFQIKLTQEAPNYSLILSINGTQLVDNGNYTCVVHGPENTPLGLTQHALIVTSSVDNIIITNSDSPPTSNLSDYDYSNYSTDYNQRPIITSEADTRTLRCIAHGGYPPPDVTVHLGPNDVTDYFRLARSSRTTGAEGLQVKHYFTERTSTPQFRLSASDDGKHFRCVATSKDVATNASVARIIVQYAPIVRCESKSVMLNERNVFLECDVRSRPKAKITWVIDSQGTELEGDDAVEDYFVIPTNHKRGLTVSQLVLRQVRWDSFHAYELIATNNIGTTRVTVQLTQKLVSTTRRPIGPVIRSHSSRQMQGDGNHDYIHSLATLPIANQVHSKLLSILLAVSGIFSIT